MTTDDKNPSAYFSLPPGPMSTNMTLLPDGRVLVGDALGIYDPATDTYERFPYRKDAVVLARGTLLADKKTVLLTGGEGEGEAITNRSRLYDVETKTVREGPPMHASREKHAQILMKNGKVLVVGGTDYVDETRAWGDIYDPVANTFTATWMVDAGSTEIDAVDLPDGRILVFGAGVPELHDGRSYIHYYDPDTDSWTEAPEPEPKFTVFAAVRLHDDRVLAVGDPHSALFDPTTHTWTLTPDHDMHASPRHSTLVLPCGNVFSTGITDRKLYGSGQDMYDPKRNLWFDIVQAKPRVLVRDTETLLLPDGRVMVSLGQLVDDSTTAESRSKPLFFDEPR